MNFNGSNYLPKNVKRVAINVSSSGDTALVTALTNRRIRVIAMFLTSSGTVNVKFKSGSNDITGLDYLVANAGLVLPECNVGWFETGIGEALNINLSAAVAVGGVLVYEVI